MKNIYKQLFSGGVWAFAGMLITSLSGLAVNGLLARILSVEAMGAYFLTMSMVIVSAVVAQLGLNLAVVRLVAESLGTGKPARAARAVFIAIRYVALGAFIVAIVLVTGAGAWLAKHAFNSGLMVAVMTLAGLWVIVLSFQNLLSEIFRGFHDIRLTTIFGGLVTSVLSAVMFSGFWLLQGQGNIKEVITLSILAGAVSTLVAAFILRGKYKSIRGKSNLRDSELLSIAWPLWFTNLMLIALTQADLWIIGMFQSQGDVAVYGAALRLATLVGMPLLIVNAGVPPLIAEMYASGEKKDLERALRVTATIAGIPSFIVLAVFVLFGESILGIVFGDYYREGSSVLAVLSLGKFMVVWAGSCEIALMMTGHQKRIMVITMACGFATIAGSIWLVQIYGMTGVAGAIAFGMTLQSMLMLFSVKRNIGLWTHVQLPDANLKFRMSRIKS